MLEVEEIEDCGKMDDFAIVCFTAFVLQIQIFYDGINVKIQVVPIYFIWTPYLAMATSIDYFPGFLALCLLLPFNL